MYFETVEPYLTTWLRLPRHDRGAGGRKSSTTLRETPEELTVDLRGGAARPQFVMHEFEPSADPVDRPGALRADLRAVPAGAA